MDTESRKPSVSIALATFNGESFIAEQLSSLASQTFLPSEIVISDDNSTDRTIDIVKEFAKHAPFPVRILPHHQRLGFSDNFLLAAEHCTGSYIAFCDQDDFWLPNKLEVQLARIIKDDSLLSIHPLIVTDEQLEHRPSLWTQGIKKDAVFEVGSLYQYGMGWGNSMVFEASLVRLYARDKRPRQPERHELPLSHDHWIYTLATGLGRISHIAEPLLLYRQHNSNAYGARTVPLWIKIRAAIHIPYKRFIVEEEFNLAMAYIFNMIAINHQRFSKSAEVGRDFRLRKASLCRHRITIYKGNTIRQRMASYTHSRKDVEYIPSLKSSFKELTIGVTGLGRIISTLF